MKGENGNIWSVCSTRKTKLQKMYSIGKWCYKVLHVTACYSLLQLPPLPYRRGIYCIFGGGWVTLPNTREKQKRRISCNTERARNQRGGAWNTHPITRHGVTNRDTIKNASREGNSITKCYRVFIVGERIVQRSCSRFGNPRSDVAFCDSLFRGVR